MIVDEEPVDIASLKILKESVGTDAAYNMLTAQVAYNNCLLSSSNKDLNLLKGVYGESVVDGGQVS
jgi:hypothetical protein